MLMLYYHYYFKQYILKKKNIKLMNLILEIFFFDVHYLLFIKKKSIAYRFMYVLCMCMYVCVFRIYTNVTRSISLTKLYYFCVFSSGRFLLYQ